RRIQGREVSFCASTRWNSGGAAATRTIYATIIVKRPNCLGRATPPHLQNQLDVALFASDPWPETGNYTGADCLCQAEPLITQMNADQICVHPRLTKPI